MILRFSKLSHLIVQGSCLKFDKATGSAVKQDDEDGSGDPDQSPPRYCSPAPSITYKVRLQGQDMRRMRGRERPADLYIMDWPQLKHTDTHTSDHHSIHSHILKTSHPSLKLTMTSMSDFLEKFQRNDEVRSSSDILAQIQLAVNADGELCYAQRRVCGPSTFGTVSRSQPNM
ncbi:hypothetical protein RRG08_000590 [Elysia crispata]|uniref:Uncharacterized protein n=1 Tax=Elysia crispata TaxID=231223 RepID=A0AAE0Y8R5_9GAST|nr:hypothetical protein RRG08_000590 [Elysia crispata]